MRTIGRLWLTRTLAPAIIVAERFGLMPEIIVADAAQNGALFTNDEIRMKARHWLSVMVADYRPLYKANVPESLISVSILWTGPEMELW